MGLPKININFFGFLAPKPKRNPAGTVALILKDDTQTNDVVTYKSGDDLDGVSKYIEQAFEGGPREVIVANIGLEDDYSVALEKLKNKRFNYLAVPEIDELETDVVVEWIKEKREKDR